MLARTEQPVLLPTLLLAGADVELSEPWHFAAIAGVVLLARLAVRVVVAPVLTGLSGAPLRAASLLGVGLMPSGALSIAAGLAFAARFPGKVGGTILGVAVGLALLGELLGPPSLRRALIRAGEIAPDATLTPLVQAQPPSEPEPTS
jgi:hypothetical protein